MCPGNCAGVTLMSIIALPSCVPARSSAQSSCCSISLYSPATSLNRYSEHIRGFMPRLEHCRRPLDRLSLQAHHTPHHLSGAGYLCVGWHVDRACKKRSGIAKEQVAVSRARQKARVDGHTAREPREPYLYRAVGATR